MNDEKVLCSILSRRDPNGYYILVADKKCLELLKQSRRALIIVEEIGDSVILKTRSRSAAERIARLLLAKRLLKTTI
ncbi:MAG: hypothetical protein QXJ64_08405 [Thermosphaera sp.]